MDTLPTLRESCDVIGQLMQRVGHSPVLRPAVVS